MKYLVFTLLATLAATPVISAFAQARASDDIIVYLDLGRAPYRGQTSGSLTLTNQGPGPLTDIHYKIQAPPGFSVQNECPRALAVGKSCRIRVTYWAQIPGYVSADMWVTTSDKSYDVRITAYGEEDPFRNVPRPPPIPGRP